MPSASVAGRQPGRAGTLIVPREGCATRDRLQRPPRTRGGGRGGRCGAATCRAACRGHPVDQVTAGLARMPRRPDDPWRRACGRYWLTFTRAGSTGPAKVSRTTCGRPIASHGMPLSSIATATSRAAPSEATSTVVVASQGSAGPGDVEGVGRIRGNRDGLEQVGVGRAEDHVHDPAAAVRDGDGVLGAGLVCSRPSSSFAHRPA